MSAAKKGWVWNSPVPVPGAKLHYPTDEGVVTFVAGEPREAPAEVVAALQEQGYAIEQAEVPAEPEPEQPTDKGAFDYDSADDETLRQIAGVDEDEEVEREELVARAKEARGDA